MRHAALRFARLPGTECHFALGGKGSQNGVACLSLLHTLTHNSQLLLATLSKSYAYNAGDTHRAPTVAPSTLRQTLHMNIQFNFNTKLSKSLCYSNNTYNASSLPAGDAKLGQSNTQSTISTRWRTASGRAERTQPHATNHNTTLRFLGRGPLGPRILANTYSHSFIQSQ